MKVTIITRDLCGGCLDLKEILSAHDIEFSELDAASANGMAELSMVFDGPDTMLPAVVCECYTDMEFITDLLDQTVGFGTVGVVKE